MSTLTVDIGAEQLTKFDESWPHTDSFYSSLSKEVITLLLKRVIHLDTQPLI